MIVVPSFTVKVTDPWLTVPAPEVTAAERETVWTLLLKVAVWLAAAVVVAALFTVCVSAAGVLVLKLLSAPQTAAVECAATDSAVALNVACPPLSVPVPSVVVPSLNVTVPVGVPAPPPLGLTVAVKVTDCPNAEGLADEVIVVVVATEVTT